MHRGHGQSGFTLIEILVSMALASLLLYMVVGTSFSSRRNLDETINNIERIIRFSSDEASLQNKFIRLGFPLEELDQRPTLEIAQSNDFVIDIEGTRNFDDLTEEEQEEMKSSGRFTPLPEFNADDFTPSGAVKIVAVGSTLTQKLHTTGKPFVYFYPTGEKDSVIIILATEEEMVALSTEPYSQVINREYVALEGVNFGNEDYVEKLIEKANELYDEWLSN
ncbi:MULTISPECIES: Tfp pilus assembly protein FimT/FimU [Halobacteriovorax]|uniref:Type II secretion system protein n=1 Tax=Halobacteriovorax vibrionivorans TaxID=2152716 RepID=A0ABY0IDS2_9BACT|nr:MULTISPECIES: type II secretion system protein [Halobacteriovorax]RZF21100.1 type II secretion system protein [Halobacteriovorax vibrionivorans]TGD47014.1 type II secretion system protein [Halobacteriovorax sp. Y22]